MIAGELFDVALQWLSLRGHDRPLCEENETGIEVRASIHPSNESGTQKGSEDSRESSELAKFSISW
jgi:hypothetical protein